MNEEKCKDIMKLLDMHSHELSRVMNVSVAISNIALAAYTLGHLILDSTGCMQSTFVTDGIRVSGRLQGVFH